MPELPEVECVRQGILDAFSGQIVTSVWHDGLKNLLDFESLPLQDLQGELLETVERRGKYMRWLTPRFQLLAHLGMSGVFQVGGARSKHTHLEIGFEDGTLCYTDPRRFGYFCMAPRFQSLPRWELLGPDALDRACTGAKMSAVAERSTVPVKTWIMDQQKLAGVGNIYASEGLFRAGIHPQRTAGSLSLAEWNGLVRELKTVMRASIRNRGTTFSDYRLTNGRGGSFQTFLRVFQKEGEPCPVCGCVIQKQVLAGRSTFYCPNCQK